MSQLKIVLFLKEGTVDFSGRIDESSDFAPFQIGLLTQIKINIERVTSVNSMGIRKWMEWIMKLPAALKITFVKCPKVMVEQFNMVDNFLPVNAIVASFYVPYYNEEIDEVINMLYELGKHYQTGQITPLEEVPCGPGGIKKAVLDVIPKQYFKFVQRR